MILSLFNYIICILLLIITYDLRKSNTFTSFYSRFLWPGHGNTDQITENIRNCQKSRANLD